MAEPSNSSSGEEEEAASSPGSGSESEPEPEPEPKKQASTGKRPAAEADGGDMKRKKTVVAVAAPDADTFGEKKQQQQLFQRLWSEDNEIELIQGMIDYVEEKGKDPLADVNDFHEFVKGSLHVDVNDRQVLTKARRLKKKFENNAAKVVTKGKVRSFSNPHEKRMYDLSKTLWGTDANKNLVNVKLTPKKKAVGGSGNGNEVVVQPKVVQPLRAVRGLDYFGWMGLPITDEVIMNKGLDMLSGPKKVEMEAKWRSLKMQELEHFLKKVDVLKEQAEVVLNAIAKSGAK